MTARIESIQERTGEPRSMPALVTVGIVAVIGFGIWRAFSKARRKANEQAVVTPRFRREQDEASITGEGEEEELYDDDDEEDEDYDLYDE